MIFADGLPALLYLAVIALCSVTGAGFLIVGIRGHSNNMRNIVAGVVQLTVALALVMMGLPVLLR